MKRLVLVLLLLAGLASPALAGNLTLAPGYGPYHKGSGGEFTFTPVGGWLDLSGYSSRTTGQGGYGGSFQTFCLEMNEYILEGSSYVGSLGPEANLGGGGPNPDPVSQGTGWLYSQFASDNWQAGLTYDYTSARSNAAALQEAIWFLEQEISSYSGTNIYINAAILRFGTIGNAMGGHASDFGVSALNLTDSAGNRKQDQLHYAPVPDGGTTLMLLGGALIGLGALRRKFRA